MIRPGRALITGKCADAGSILVGLGLPAHPVRDPALKVKGDESFLLSVPEPEPAHNEAQDIALNIIFEDDHLIVIDKQAGLVVHPSAGHNSVTLVNALLARGPARRVSDDPADPHGGGRAAASDGDRVRVREPTASGGESCQQKQSAEPAKDQSRLAFLFCRLFFFRVSGGYRNFLHH